MTVIARFADEVRAAMARKNVTTYALADALGVSQHQVNRWRQGYSVPLVAMAVRIADALDAPLVVDLVRQYRTFRCRTCRQVGVSEGTGLRRRYCSDTCRYLAQKLGKSGAPITTTMTRLRLYAEAVGEFCRECSPSGLCRDAACPLRPVSPLPVAANLRPVETPVDGRKHRWQIPGERERASVRMRAAYAANPERARKISEANRRRWAEMTPERRTEIGRKIAAGRYAA